MAVTRPGELTYQAIASSPAASGLTAWWWICLASLISSFVLQAAGGSLKSPVGVLGWLMSALFQAVMVSVSFLILVWLLNLFARPFGGHAGFVQAAYTIAAINFPLTICTALPAVPRVLPYPASGVAVLLELLLGCYQLVLTVIAAKAVHRISWAGAIVAAVAAPVAFILGVGAILYVGFRL